MPAQVSAFHNWLPGTTPLPTVESVPDVGLGPSPYVCPVFGAAQQNLFPVHGRGPRDPSTGPTLGMPGPMNWHRSKDNVPSGPGEASVPTNKGGVQPEGVAIPDRERSWLGYFSYGSIDGSKDNTSAFTLATTTNVNDDKASDTAMPDLPPCKEKSKFVLASWQELKRIPDRTEHILTRRPVTKMGDLIRGNYLQSTFESYLFAFDKNELPPFIHRASITKDVGTQEANFAHLPEALANCKAIMSLALHNIDSSRPLTLKTLLLEIQRIHDEV